MKPPQRLRIAGARWKLKLVENLRGEDGDQLAGLCNFQAHEISVEATDCSELQKTSSLHEATHAVGDTLGYEWPEVIVAQIESAIFSLLRDNPSFVRWLMSKDTDGVA